jgi:hypothetical protein
MDEIKEIQKRGEAATDVTEIFSVSLELQRLSREEIPAQIWAHISSMVKAP